MNIENAKITLSGMKECAQQAGIYHAWFICFGTLLGAIRPSKRLTATGYEFTRGFIQSDDDMDVGILSDKITEDQEYDYIERLRTKGLMMHRGEKEFALRKDGRHVWRSIRAVPPPVGVRCCNWFWFRHRGYYWHSKGKAWVNPKKMNPNRLNYNHNYDAMALGVPEDYLKSLVEYKIDGLTVNIPMHYGSLLDTWYQKWIVPKGGSSDHKHVMAIPNWEEPQKWVTRL